MNIGISPEPIPGLFEELERRVSRWVAKPHLHTDHEISALARSFSATVGHIFDQSAAFLAVHYANGTSSFEVCDAAINHLFGDALAERFDYRGTLFYEVYLAFDAGEYHRASDRSNNLELEHTRTRIDAIVSKYQLSGGGSRPARA
jgi:hypothetical protein